MEDSGDATTICMYSQIDSCEVAHSRDLAEYWEDPASFFLMSGAPISPHLQHRVHAWHHAALTTEPVLCRQPAEGGHRRPGVGGWEWQHAAHDH